MLDLQLACIEKDNLPHYLTFKKWLEATITPFHSNCEITIRLVDMEESKTLNFTYRKQDKPTNVLAFPFLSPPGIHSNLLGDVIICAPIVKFESHIYKKNIEAYWAHIVIHGTLHLLGYNHLKQTDKNVMETLEKNIMSILGYSDPYQID